MKFRGDIVIEANPEPRGSGSAILTSSLQLKLMQIETCVAIDFNKKWHSKMPNIEEGEYLCYGAFFNSECYAVFICSQNKTTLHIDRMAISNLAPKNTASRLLKVLCLVIPKTITQLTTVSYENVVKSVGLVKTQISYPSVIYKAVNWVKLDEKPFKRNISTNLFDVEISGTEITWAKNISQCGK